MQFNADVADGMPWKFIPTQREVMLLQFNVNACTFIILKSFKCSLCNMGIVHNSPEHFLGSPL